MDVPQFKHSIMMEFCYISFCLFVLAITVSYEQYHQIPLIHMHLYISLAYAQEWNGTVIGYMQNKNTYDKHFPKVFYQFAYHSPQPLPATYQQSYCCCNISPQIQWLKIHKVSISLPLWRSHWTKIKVLTGFFFWEVIGVCFLFTYGKTYGLCSIFSQYE